MRQVVANQEQTVRAIGDRGARSGRTPLRRALGGLWDGWKEIASFIGDFQARLLLTTFYFTIAAPFALVARLIDPLRTRRSNRASGWVLRPPDTQDIGSHRRQF